MSTRFVLCAAGGIALATSCAVPWIVRTERLAVEDRVVFRFSVDSPRRSMAIHNRGPGPIEVVLGEGVAHSHPIEIQEGESEYVRPAFHSSLEIRHPGSGAGNVEWTIAENLRDEVEIEVPDSR